MASHRIAAGHAGVWSVFLVVTVCSPTRASPQTWASPYTRAWLNTQALPNMRALSSTWAVPNTRALPKTAALPEMRALPKGTMWSMSSLPGSDTTVLVFEVYWCQFRLFRSAFHGY